MGESTGPGLMALIRTPSAMWSRAAVRVRWLTAAFEAAYALAPASRQCAPRLEATLTITPPPCARMWAISCFIDRNTPLRLTASTSSQMSSS